MPAPESPPDFDDELLSAYLDDQLSPAERAAVDARLAGDESAVRLLAELRAIQQAVRDMPSVPVGADLRASVLRQVEQSSSGGGNRPAATHPAAESSVAHAPVPAAPFGRSRRGWAWAGLAMAAALLIMAFTGDEGRREEPVGKVAQRLERLPATSGRSEGGSAPPELRAVPRSELGDNRAPGEGLSETRSGPRTLSEEESSVGVVRSAPLVPEPAVPKTDFAPPAEAASERRIAAPSAGIQPPLVVHVSMPQSAWRNRTFDEVLRHNGIAIDPLSAPTGNAPVSSYDAERSGGVAVDKGLAQGGELGQRGQAVTVDVNTSPASVGLDADRTVASETEEPQTSEQPVDIVLVEAAPTQVEACLTEIHDDLENYLAVEVSDPARQVQFADRLKVVDQVDRQSDVSSWRQYNRGQFAPSQRVQLNRLNMRATGAEQQATKRYRSYTADDDAFGGGYAGAGRARRLDQSQQVPQQRQMGRDASLPTPPPTSPMQVLFLLSPDPNDP